MWRFYRKRPALVLLSVFMIIASVYFSGLSFEIHAEEEDAAFEIPVKTGWNYINDEWYWITPEHTVKTGWIRVRGNWYYLNEKGAMLTGPQEIDGRQYFLADTGEMRTGWLMLDGKWYYFCESGYKKTGWIFDDGSWYFLDTDGVMQTGWVLVRGKWYFLRENGRMKTGWLKYGGSWYLLSASGSMMSDGWLVKDGHSYHFDSKGRLDKDTDDPQTLVTMPGYYISPMYAGNLNTPGERIEAMIRRAYDYKRAGTKYKICKSMAPGKYADCSGLVMQCLYAAGFDPAPATPAHHALPQNEYDSRTLYKYVNMKHVSYSEIKRGDLIFYRNDKYNVIIHVAIYLGDGKVIESWPPAVTDKYGVSSYPHKYIYGVARPFE